ncbi:MAG: VWA domain-containing protein [Polyangiales bacterium]
MKRQSPLLIGLTIAACAALAAYLWNLSFQNLDFTFRGAEYEVLQPRWLVVFAVAPLFFLAASRSLSDLPRVQRWLGVLFRTALAAVLTLAVARLARTTEVTRVSTIYLIDVSDSVTDESIADAREDLIQVYAERGDNDVQLITFASESTAVPLGEDEDVVPEDLRHVSEGAARPDDEESERASAAEHAAGRATDMQGALQLAYGLFPAGHLRRVVIAGDGAQTRGDLLAEASRAARFGVQVHFRVDERGAPPEVALRGVTIPDRLEVGEPFPVRARIFSTTEANVRIRLFQGETLNGLDSIRDVELSPGDNEIEFRSITRVAGPVTYRMEMSPADGVEDRFAANNRFETTVVVPGKPTVLYVEGAQGRASYLAQALTAADYEVEVRSPRAIPTSVRELERFDFFVLSDVSADQVSLSQMDAIERYVRDLGGGFIMAGGERAFGLGGWQGTRMERLLPVRMDAQRRRDQPSLALGLVIDRSGSMNGAKMELAKEAARATAELLSSDDYISVIGFDSQPERIVRMQSARNRTRILRDIGRMTARGGTAIFPALDMAYQDLSVTRARIKHVILLTDGQAPDAGITELTQVMRAEGITVSTVGLGADVNRVLLQSIANLGGGRSYLTSDPHNVPRIFMRETTTVARSSAVEEYFQPSVVSRADFLRGVNIESAPFLRGYVATRAKPHPAQVILQSDLGEPILARWRVGLGWSMAWTSDVKNRWAVDWLRWRGYSQFWAQLIREHMRNKRRQRLDMVAETFGDEVRVSVDAIGGNDEFLNGLTSTLKIEGPMGARRARDGEDDPQLRRTREVPMLQTAPGRYEARLPLDAYGSFVLSADHRLEGRSVAESATQLANPYPSEYRALEPDIALFERVAELTGGEASPAPARLFDAGDETIEAHQELWPWLLYLALALFILDLLLRRVRLFDRDFSETV